MAFTEDLDVFFDIDEHAVAATYTHSGVAAVSTNVILDNEYSAPDGTGIVGLSSSAPVATGKTSVFSNAARGDTLALVVEGASVTFKITEVMHDGTGVTLLRLSRD